MFVSNNKFVERVIIVKSDLFFKDLLNAMNFVSFLTLLVLFTARKTERLSNTMTTLVAYLFLGFVQKLVQHTLRTRAEFTQKAQLNYIAPQIQTLSINGKGHKQVSSLLVCFSRRFSYVHERMEKSKLL